MLEEKTRKKLGLAKMLMQQGTKPAPLVQQTVQSELFDLKNFRQGLRNNLQGSMSLIRSQEER